MKIRGTNIAMVRGDSESVTVSCKGSDGAPRPFQPGDRLTMTVKKDPYQEEALIRKTADTFPEGKAVLALLPEDTGGLQEGFYVYDLRLTTSGGAVKTIVPASEFRLRGNVTHD